MPILGITGGVATGKSTFRKLLLERIDADFFDSDACARELLDTNDVVREQVLENVSPNAYNSAGTPDRAVLREIIYNDLARKKTLEGILHPVIRERWTTRARAVQQQARMFLVDIPLLYETRAESLFDKIVVVASSEAAQIHRLTTIRRLENDLARKILASQWTLSVKIRAADHVVWNDGSYAALESQADLLAAHFARKYD